MNCEKCQELIHDLLDGTISRADEFALNTHIKECLDCESVRQDLSSIVGFCRTHRGEYEAPPNCNALWLRIRNTLEAEAANIAAKSKTRRKSFFGELMGRSWEMSLPQLASFAVAIVLLVSIVTVVGIRRGGNNPTTPEQTPVQASNINERVFQRQQVINYWKQRVE